MFHLPAFAGSWAQCLEGLAHPHTGRLRPIVFDHALAADRDDVVLAHLNHRLVQMCLRLLRAEVWAPAGLQHMSRVTARLAPDTVLDTPAVIAHARLVVVGTDSQRLHEEVITAGGRLREGRFARMNVGEVDRALAAALSTEPSAAVKARLQELWPRHTEALAQSLEARMRDRLGGLTKTLADRADKEVANITAVLEELRRSILAELDAPPPEQLDLWPTDEREQLERDVESLRARVQRIPEEITQETARIRARFADPQPRLFPVAVTFLVPEKHARG